MDRGVSWREMRLSATGHREVREQGARLGRPMSPGQSRGGHSRRAQALCISGLVVEYIVAIDVTRVRFPADAIYQFT